LPLTAYEYLPAQLPALTVDYVEDEAELPIAVQRRLNRERRQAQMNRQTKDSIRKQKARERSALIKQMIKYILMMVVYFLVLMGRRNVLHAQSFLDGLLTGFMDSFGEQNSKTFMDIAQYADFYDWLEGPFISTLLPDEDYSGRPIEPEKQRVMMYNRIVGGLRMRQLRVTPNAGCTIAVNVQDEFNPTRGPDAGTTRKRKYVDKCFSNDWLCMQVLTTAPLRPHRYVDKCYSNYQPGDTWSRAPFGPLEQVRALLLMTPDEL